MTTINIQSTEDFETLIDDLNGRLDNMRDDLGMLDADAPDMQDIEGLLKALAGLHVDGPGAYRAELSFGESEQLTISLENCNDFHDGENDFGVEAFTSISERIGNEWQIYLPEEIRNLNGDSECGRDCLKVISAADVLISLARDIPESDRMKVRTMAARQCSVYFFG